MRKYSASEDLVKKVDFTRMDVGLEPMKVVVAMPLFPLHDASQT